MISFPLPLDHGTKLLAKAVLRVYGGRGSGNFGHAGRPGQIGGSGTTVFHGTSSKVLKRILKEGLRSKYSGKNFPGLSKPKTVYVSTNKSNAQAWAKSISDQLPLSYNPVVLKIVIPKKEAKKYLKPDEHFKGSDWSDHPSRLNKQFSKDIPPAWITGVFELREGEYWVRAAEANDDIVVYAVVMIPGDEEEIITLGGPGSGNFGHAGRPGQVGGSGKGVATIAPGIFDAIQQADGGFTYHVLTGQSPKTGFVVSLHKDRERVIPVKEATVDTLAQYAVDNWDLLNQPDNFLGGWHNPENGKVYLDVSTVVDSADEAFRLGAGANQEAYFDLAKGQSVPIAKRAAYEETRIVNRQSNAGRVGRLVETTAWARSDTGGVRAREEDSRDTYVTLGGPGSGNYGHQGGEGGPGNPGGSSKKSAWLSDDTIRQGSEMKATAEAHDEWARGMSGKEKYAVQNYITSHRLVNRALNKDGTFKLGTEALQEALESAPKPPPPSLVWRGLRSHADQLRQLSIGDTVQLNGFQSTSVDASTASRFAHTGLVLEIKPKSGGYLQAISPMFDEFEFLLPHGRKYRVRGQIKARFKTWMDTVESFDVLQLEEE